MGRPWDEDKQLLLCWHSHSDAFAVSRRKLQISWHYFVPTRSYY